MVNMKINPCPWCKSRARLEQFKQPYSGKNYYVMRCSNDTCNKDIRTVFGSNKKDIIRNWNQGFSYKYVSFNDIKRLVERELGNEEYD